MQGSIPNNHIEQSLFNEVICIDNLIIAAQNAIKGKLNRNQSFSFYSHLGSNTSHLYHDIITGSYCLSPTKEFDRYCISGQKVRHINSLELKDLVMQHSIYQTFYNAIKDKLIYDSYGCRKGKGTTKAGDRCQLFLRQSPKDSYYLQLDIRKYYYSLDHQITKDTIYHLCKDRELTDLIAQQFPQGTDVGMHVGSLIAQVMGIIYLNPLDHYIKRVLKCKRYIRYVDDFVIIGESKERSHFLKTEIERFIKEHLKLELSKWKIAPISKGINFVGYRTWQRKRIIRKRSMKVFNKALRKRKVESLQSCLGHALKTSSYSGMKRKLESNGYLVVDGKILH